jgi:hypothetical protein
MLYLLGPHSSFMSTAGLVDSPQIIDQSHLLDRLLRYFVFSRILLASPSRAQNVLSGPQALGFTAFEDTVTPSACLSSVAEHPMWL